MQSYPIPKPSGWLFQQAILLFIMLTIDGFRTTKMRPNSSQLSFCIRRLLRTFETRNSSLQAALQSSKAALTWLIYNHHGDGPNRERMAFFVSFMDCADYLRGFSMNRILHKRLIPLGVSDTVVRSRGQKPSLLISNMLMVHGIAITKEPPDALGIFDRCLSAPQATRFNTFGHRSWPRSGNVRVVVQPRCRGRLKELNFLYFSYTIQMVL